MRNFKSYCLFIIFALLLTGCVDEAIEESPTNTKISIESYNVSEKEELLISKTGVEQIEFFKLNGTLKEEDDLQFSVEVYENGKVKEELLKTTGNIETNYKDSLISFGVKEIGGAEHSLELLNGIPSGLATTSYANNMTGSTFSRLISESITLEKDKPVYLVAWLGTTKNSMRGVGEENGDLPEAISEYELAFLYKVLWTDKDMH